MYLSFLPLTPLYKKKVPIQVQPYKMLNTSDVKPVKNFAHSFFFWQLGLSFESFYTYWIPQVRFLMFQRGKTPSPLWDGQGWCDSNFKEFHHLTESLSSLFCLKIKRVMEQISFTYERAWIYKRLRLVFSVFHCLVKQDVILLLVLCVNSYPLLSHSS